MIDERLQRSLEFRRRDNQKLGRLCVCDRVGRR
jgi:hypothetical protein